MVLKGGNSSIRGEKEASRQVQEPRDQVSGAQGRCQILSVECFVKQIERIDSEENY